MGASCLVAPSPSVFGLPEPRESLPAAGAGSAPRGPARGSLQPHCLPRTRPVSARGVSPGAYETECLQGVGGIGNEAFPAVASASTGRRKNPWAPFRLGAKNASPEGVGLRAAGRNPAALPSHPSLEPRITAAYTLRPIARVVGAPLRSALPGRGPLRAQPGLPSVPPERFLRPPLLQALRPNRSRRVVAGQLDGRLLVRLFMSMGRERAWGHSTPQSPEADRCGLSRRRRLCFWNICPGRLDHRHLAPSHSCRRIMCPGEGGTRVWGLGVACQPRGVREGRRAKRSAGQPERVTELCGGGFPPRGDATGLETLAGKSRYELCELVSRVGP